MAKILLVEDDNNLREIYEARLMAEGYDIVSARDGEEALTVAIKEKPDLVISDVMMPKISGFDMLDILRTTEETKHVKVIMMTALSQAEDKARAEKLGADRYLVKSQVTLEDVAKVAKEVLEGLDNTAPAATPALEPVAVPEPVAATPAPAPAEEPVATPVAAAPEPDVEAATPPSTVIDTEEQAIAKQLESIISQSVAGASISASVEPPVIPVAEPAAPIVVPEPEAPAAPAKAQRRVIEPLNDVREDMSPKLEELAAKEAENEAQAAPQLPHVAPTTAAPASEIELPKPAPAPAEEKIDPNSIAL
jgi:CheY-like chemotaxis protein